MEPKFSSNIKMEPVPVEKESSPSSTGEKVDNNLTISTKLSTDQLICKSPRDSPTPRSPARSLTKYGESGSSEEYLNGAQETDALVYLGLLQMLFGGMMVIFGVLVLVHDASLSQLCGGVWGGCVAMTAGLLAIGAAARECCPLRPNLARLALTAHLAVSLIALAVANLVLVFAAIGLARDSSRTDVIFFERQTPANNSTAPILHEEAFAVNSNWAALLANMGLLIACTCECVAAAVSAWRCARSVCSCFRPPEAEKSASGAASGAQLPTTSPSVIAAAAAAGNPKDVLVSAWLGMQPLVPASAASNRPSTVMTTLPRPLPPVPGAPLYVVAPNTRHPINKQLIPASLFAVPTSRYLMPPHVHRRPIAAKVPRNPYGSYDNIYRKRKRYPSDQQLQRYTLPHKLDHRREKRNRKERRGITEEEVARTYTGLDRTIAEQFIVHCDSNRNQHSLESKSDESSGFDTSLSLTNSDIASNEYLVEKL